MKYLYPAVLLLILGGCASGTPSNKYYNNQIYGMWDCEYTSEEDGTTINAKSSDVYVRNGKVNSFGNLNVQFAPGSETVEYSVSMSGSWKIQNGYLITESSETKIVNISHPELDEIFNLNDFLPQNISDSSKILKITRNEMSLKSETDGSIYNCVRK